MEWRLRGGQDLVREIHGLAVGVDGMSCGGLMVENGRYSDLVDDIFVCCQRRYHPDPTMARRNPAPHPDYHRLCAVAPPFER